MPHRRLRPMRHCCPMHHQRRTSQLGVASLFVAILSFFVARSRTRGARAGFSDRFCKQEDGGHDPHPVVQN
jgi:hypothetical protein